MNVALAHREAFVGQGCAASETRKRRSWPSGFTSMALSLAVGRGIGCSGSGLFERLAGQ